MKDNETRKIPGVIPEWSDTVIKATRDLFFSQSFLRNPVRMKKIDGTLGFISIADATSDKYNIHHDDDDIIEHYNSVSEMIEDGWVID